MSTLLKMPKALRAAAAALLMLIPGAAMVREAAAQQGATALPAPALDLPKPAKPGAQTAVFAGGCFWGVQAVFEHVKGVQRAVSGYAGGAVGTAHYELVSTGTTGHAESVEVTFDPAQITYGQILRIFFSVAHDPTQLDYQGPDVGTQYRSAIFTADAAQQRVAQAYIAQLNGARAFAKPVVTRVDPLKGFFPAEGYHQDYLLLHPDQPYIVFNDMPKLAHLKRAFPDRYREAPVTVAATRAR